jgi:hypothetical protein
MTPSPRPMLFIVLMGTAGLISGLLSGLATFPFTDIWSPLTSPTYEFAPAGLLLAVQVALRGLEGAALALILLKFDSSLVRIFAFCFFGSLTSVVQWFIEWRSINDHLVLHSEPWRYMWRWQEAGIKAARAWPMHLLLAAGAELLSRGAVGPFPLNTFVRGLGLFGVLGLTCGLALISTMSDLSGPSRHVVVCAVVVVHFIAFYLALRRRPSVPGPRPADDQERDVAGEAHLRALAVAFLSSTLVGVAHLLWSVYEAHRWRGYYWPLYPGYLEGWIRESFVTMLGLTLGWIGWPLWRQAEAGRRLAIVVTLVFSITQLRWLYRDHYHSQDAAAAAAGLIWAGAVAAFLGSPRAARLCSQGYRERWAGRAGSILHSPFLLLPLCGLALYALLVAGVRWAIG